MQFFETNSVGGRIASAKILATIFEHLKSATKIALLILILVFCKNSLIELRFLASLRNRVFSNSKVDTFFVAENK